MSGVELNSNDMPIHKTGVKNTIPELKQIFQKGPLYWVLGRPLHLQVHQDG